MQSDQASPRPIKLTVAALGGQGGGVLADWLVEVAEAQGYLVQSTSVPGVAQRTGATIYYLEFFPRKVALQHGREPVMTLMPVPGDVDCVIASELAEAGRMVQRGLITPDHTTLIASTHRSYAIAEKMAMGDGRVDERELTKLVRSHARRSILFDMQAVAERNQSVISSVLLGALCGSGVLPFTRESFENAIRHSGIAVSTNLAAFEDARASAARGDSAGPDAAGDSDRAADMQKRPAVPAQARSPALQPLLDRILAFPQPLVEVALEGVRRMIDYQDPEYARIYLQRLERVITVDTRASGQGGGANGEGESTEPWALSEAVARGLALWMSFEDTIRVADLKTRATRFSRVREEVRATEGQILGITEFMKPRVTEIAGTMPAAIGRWILGSRRVHSWLERFTGGRQIRTSTLSGFLLLYSLAGLRSRRRGTLRYQQENQRIQDWLDRIEQLAPRDYALAVELARAQRLVKGYGETHERGWRNFSALVEQIGQLELRNDGAHVLERLQQAALADEDGKTLASELAHLTGPQAAQTRTA